MRSRWMAGAIALALMLSSLAPAAAQAAPYQPLWIQAPPKDARFQYVVGSAAQAPDAESARQEAIRDAIRKLDALVGFDASPEHAERQKAFNRKLIQALLENRSSGAVIEDAFTQNAPEGKAKVHVLVRYPKRGLVEAKADLARLQAARLSLPEAARRIAEGLERYVSVEPTFGKLAIGSFAERETGKRFKLSGAIETELGHAVGRLDNPQLKLSVGRSAMTLQGTYRLAPNKRALLMVAQLVDVKQSTVMWTSPEYTVTEGDFSELAPPAPVAAKPTPQPAAPKRQAKALSTQQKVGKPRIMVILPETHISRPAPDPAGETELTRQLLEAGFKLVDQSQSKKVRENEQYLAQLRNDPQKVAALGREYGAEVVVFGEAFSEAVGAAPGGIKVMARVEARAVRCDTAEILVAHGLEAEATEASELVSAKKALRQAGQLVAKYFVEQLANRWSREAEGSRSLEVHVSDISYPMLVKLKATLKGEIDGVQAFHQRSFEQNMARFEVDYEGDPQDLVDDLVSRSFEGHDLELVKLTGSKVELRLR